MSEADGQILCMQFSKWRHRRPQSAIFLDRDGVVNQRIQHGYVTHWSQFKFVPGVQRVLADLSGLGLPLIVVSNQAGVGKGLVSRTTLAGITRRFVSILQRAGAQMDAAYYCPHTPDDQCGCRKPRPGLLLRAATDWGVNLSRSVLIGDSWSDIEAAHAAGCWGILVKPCTGPSHSGNSLAQSKSCASASVHLREIPDTVRKLLGQQG
jgi:D-glycero-D-manno-heptose 1,7-bisphosphate phosphatase